MNADVWPCLSQISFIFSPDAVHFGQKTFETGCKTYKVPFILGRSVNWWLPCGDHFSHQGGSCHQCPWGLRLQLPKPGNFHKVQTCCRCRLSAPQSAGGPFEATRAPKNLSSSPWASDGISTLRKEKHGHGLFASVKRLVFSATRSMQKCRYHRKTLCQPHAKGLSLGFCKQVTPRSRNCFWLRTCPRHWASSAWGSSQSRATPALFQLCFCPFSTLYLFLETCPEITSRRQPSTARLQCPVCSEV